MWCVKIIFSLYNFECRVLKKNSDYVIVNAVSTQNNKFWLYNLSVVRKKNNFIVYINLNAVC